jgi:CBS domain-containing protein
VYKEAATMVTTVNRILESKGDKVWTIEAGETVLEALKLMSDRGIGAIVAVEKGAIVGIFSERDYARKVVLKGKASKDTPVREVMTTRVRYVQPTNTVEECMALMTGKKIRHLPVLFEGKLVGLVSIGDVVKAMISEKEFIIDQLENYITQG